MSGADGGRPPAPGAAGPAVICVLPAYNEAENLPWVLAQAPRALGGHAVGCLVVDDGSTDATAAVARAAGAEVLAVGENRGGGHALRLGFAAAAARGARWVVTLDADGQHRFADLPALLAPLWAGRADVVVGSRRLGAGAPAGALRGAALGPLNRLVGLAAGHAISDCASGYRAFDVEKLCTLPLREPRHHTAELIIVAARRGLRIAEVPITVDPRRSGRSKKGPDWRYGLRFSATVARAWWRSR